MSILAIIPAKKHSVRIPHKNVQLLDGVPLFWHSVMFARREGVPYVVSTDDTAVMEFCKHAGAPVAKEKVDDSNMLNCINSVLSAYPDVMRYVLLQPTSPLRPTGLIRAMMQLGDNVYTAEKIKIVGHLKRVKRTSLIVQGREQDAQSFLHQYNGSALLGTRKLAEQGILLDPEKAVPFFQKAPYNFQIDTPEDLDTMRSLISGIGNK